MKKFYTIFLGAVFSLLAVSCFPETEQDNWTPGEAEDAFCYGVYFPVQDASGYHIYSPTDQPKAVITVARTNTSGAITVPVEATFSEEGIFEVTPIAFEDGQAETTFTLTFPTAAEGVEYSASFQITGNTYASLYSSNAVALDFSFMKVKMEDLMDKSKTNVATVTFTEGHFGFEVQAKVKFYEVEGVRTCETYDEVVTASAFSLVTVGSKGFFGTGENVHLKFIWFTKKVDDEGNQMIDVPRQFTGFDYNDGNWVAADEGSAPTPIYTYDWFHFYTTDGGYVGSWPDWEGFLAKNPGAKTRSFYDGNGGFILTTRYYIPALSGGWSPKDGNVVGIIPGFTRVDYSFKVVGDYCANGVSPISLTAGADIASVKYQVYEGSLNSAQKDAKVEELVKDTAAPTLTDELVLDPETGKKYATLDLSPEATGTYTFIAVALDKDGNNQASGSVTFKHITAEDAADYAVDINALVEDTPARYTALHNYDSFAYSVYGSNLTDVHVGVFSAATISKYGAQTILDAVKYDEDGDYAVTEEVLAAINSDEGYYDVMTELNAETTYYLIVWATNGSLDDYAIGTYTTANIPYVWNLLGEGTYTEDVVGGLYGIGAVDVPCNVYEEATHPGLFKINGFQKPWIDLMVFQNGILADDGYPEDGKTIDDYENVLWRNVDLVIDATNPEDVRIALQDYGICLLPSDGFIDGLTSVYNGNPFSVGTYADGVIAFPTAKGLLCTLNGDGYYYANQHGGFKVVLPSSTPAAAPAKVSAKSVSATPAGSFFKTVEKMVYERDPQPVSVKVVNITYDRKEKSVSSLVQKEVKVKLD